MADKTGIEWTDATWNPIVGCSITSPGCTNCYAMKLAARLLDGNPKSPHYAGTTKIVNGNAVWTGKVALAPNHILTQPLGWKRPRAIFVNSMGDLFHESVPDAWIDRVFGIMALCPQHTFQILTKRADRMRFYLSQPLTQDLFARWFHHEYFSVQHRAFAHVQLLNQGWPTPHIWCGVSVENRRALYERLGALLAIPDGPRFLTRFISFEPLLEDVAPFIGDVWRAGDTPNIDWAIVGGESGQGARPMHPSWARNLRDWAERSNVALTFKQWGEWAPEHIGNQAPRAIERLFLDRDHYLARVGKKAAGRLLDGVKHDARPPLAHAGGLL